MRLVNTSTQDFEVFDDVDRIPSYAILSHTWTDQEVSYKDYRKGRNKDLSGYGKIQLALRQAVADGLNYIWIDTCCINKESSAELSLAINSMYRWYETSRVCYVYLQDVEGTSTHLSPNIWNARWFSRGWTLQELLAPERVVFFDKMWNRLFTKVEQAGEISRRTRIPKIVLQEPFKFSIQKFSIAARMSWAAFRHTSRTEDLAYCLMGLFDVNMPLLYGEGDQAFIRLQEQIMKASDDQSLFAWGQVLSRLPKRPSKYALHTPSGGMLAPSPSYFDSSNGRSRSAQTTGVYKTYGMTNAGLQLMFPVQHMPMAHHSSWHKAILYIQCIDDKGLELALCVTRTDNTEDWMRAGILRLSELGLERNTHIVENQTLSFRSLPNPFFSIAMIEWPRSVQCVGCFPSFAIQSGSLGYALVMCPKETSAGSIYVCLLAFQYKDCRFLVVFQYRKPVDVYGFLAPFDDESLERIWEHKSSIIEQNPGTGGASMQFSANGQTASISLLQSLDVGAWQRDFYLKPY